MAASNPGMLTEKRQVVGSFDENGVVLRELDGIEVCKGAPILQAFPIVGVTGKGICVNCCHSVV